jgi:hypothetical protein
VISLVGCAVFKGSHTSQKSAMYALAGKYTTPLGRGPDGAPVSVGCTYGDSQLGPIRGQLKEEPQIHFDYMRLLAQD